LSVSLIGEDFFSGATFTWHGDDTTQKSSCVKLTYVTSSLTKNVVVCGSDAAVAAGTSSSTLNAKPATIPWYYGSSANIGDAVRVAWSNKNGVFVATKNHAQAFTALTCTLTASTPKLQKTFNN
jgi:hypothetical protein